MHQADREHILSRALTWTKGVVAAKNQLVMIPYEKQTGLDDLLNSSASPES